MGAIKEGEGDAANSHIRLARSIFITSASGSHSGHNDEEQTELKRVCVVRATRQHIVVKLELSSYKSGNCFVMQLQPLFQDYHIYCVPLTTEQTNV